MPLAARSWQPPRNFCVEGRKIPSLRVGAPLPRAALPRTRSAVWPGSSPLSFSQNKDAMKRKQLSKRLFSSLVAAGVVAAAALAPTPALAAGGPNLAAGRTAMASGANGPYGAGNVNDGNAQSYWESPSNAFPQWVQIDLGSSVAVDQVVLKL